MIGSGEGARLGALEGLEIDSLPGGLAFPPLLPSGPSLMPLRPLDRPRFQRPSPGQLTLQVVHDHILGDILAHMALVGQVEEQVLGVYGSLRATSKCWRVVWFVRHSHSWHHRPQAHSVHSFKQAGHLTIYASKLD